jgi:hypothetical protein
MVAGRMVKQGYDELQAIDAISKLPDEYPYIDFNQLFPDTYRFELSQDATYDIISRQLKERGEVLVKEDNKEGIIFTAAKETPLTAKNKKLKKQQRIYYQQSIFLTKKGQNLTYVTNYPTVLKGDYGEIVIPLASNILKGIFFGSLAAELYPENRDKAMLLAGSRVADHPIVSKENTDVIHVIQSGETLAAISKRYTGKPDNYKKIANYNHIINVKNIQVGEKIKIPHDLLQIND